MVRFAALMIIALPLTSVAATNWAQPPLQCIENVIPAASSKPCIDFSGVKDLSKDDPAVSAEELQWWKAHKFAYGLCRSKEVFKRESEKPGSMTPVAIQIGF